MPESLLYNTVLQVQVHVQPNTIQSYKYKYIYNQIQDSPTSICTTQYNTVLQVQVHVQPNTIVLQVQVQAQLNTIQSYKYIYNPIQ